MQDIRRIMSDVRNKEHAAFILQSINWRLKDFKKEQGIDATGKDFSTIVRTGFIMNHCFILKEIDEEFARHLIDQLYLKKGEK